MTLKETIIPIAVRLLLISAVLIYAISGALFIRYLETFPDEADENVETCVNNVAINYLQSIDKCLSVTIDDNIIDQFEDCYYKYHITLAQQDLLSVEKGKRRKPDEPRTFSDSLIFTFSILTTVGYGNVAPQTFMGKLFCLIYGLIGVPLTLIVIANTGKFLSEILSAFCRQLSNLFDFMQEIICFQNVHHDVAGKIDENTTVLDLATNESQNDETIRTCLQTSKSTKINPIIVDVNEVKKFPLLITFVIYVIAGAYMFSNYEPDMDFVRAIYFNLITLTTIGLGDFVPKNESYLYVTIIYLSIGLALTTIAIEIAGYYLNRLHYIGRKMPNAKDVKIWIGGKHLTVKQLVKNFVDQFDLPKDTMKNFNLNQFVESAIDIEQHRMSSEHKRSVTKQHPYAVEYDDFERKSIDSSSLIYIDTDRSTNPSNQ